MHLKQFQNEIHLTDAKILLEFLASLKYFFMSCPFQEVLTISNDRGSS